MPTVEPPEAMLVENASYDRGFYWVDRNDAANDDQPNIRRSPTMLPCFIRCRQYHLQFSETEGFLPVRMI